MNLRPGYHWLRRKVKSVLFAALAIVLVTALGYYIGVSGEDAVEGSKTDVLKFSFLFAIPWCLSSWLALWIGQKLDDKRYNWQTNLCALFYGPILLSMLTMKYFKQRKRAKYTEKEMYSRKQDIYDLRD